MHINALTCDCEDTGLECCHSHKQEAYRARRDEQRAVMEESESRCACADCGSDIAVNSARWVTRFPMVTVPLCQDCYLASGRQNEARREVWAVDRKWHPA